MGTTNYGSQNITFKYQLEGTSPNFNKLLAEFVPKGVVNGGEFKYINGNSFTISPFVCAFKININNEESLLRVETTQNITYTEMSYALFEENPYIIATFSWLDVSENYMEISNVSYEDLKNLNGEQIVLGKLLFKNNELIPTFDYSRKDWSYTYYSYMNHTVPFKVAVKEDVVTPIYQIEVGEGKAYINGKLVEFKSTQYFDYNNKLPSDIRTDILYIDENGKLGIIAGTNGITDVPQILPYILPIALIHLPSGSSVNGLRGDYIEYLYNGMFPIHYNLPNYDSAMERLADALKDECNRASTQEENLYNKLIQETNRASAEETSILNAIKSEASRASVQESTLISELTKETNRASAQETSIINTLSTESQRRIAKDNAQQDTLDDHEKRLTNAEKYVTHIYVDGNTLYIEDLSAPE